MRYATIPSRLFSDRRKSLIKNMASHALAIFCSNDLMPRNGDQSFPFRQDSGLFSLTGIDQPETTLVLYKGSGRQSFREIAFILPQDRHHELWNGKRYSAKQCRDISGIREIYSIRKWDTVMTELLKACQKIYVFPADSETSASRWVSPNAHMAVSLQTQYPEKTFLPVMPILSTQAMVKHPEEIALLEKAILVTGNAFERVLRAIRPGMREFEAEAEITYTLSRNGCRHAFQPIVASGRAACTLHYIRNDRVLRKNELVLMDFGAEYACMAADMTRTIPVSGVFSKRQKDIYSSVLRVLENTTDMMRPGITLAQLNTECGKLIGSELIRLKILSRREIRRQDPENPLYKKYFMHGVSHHLGYDVHDMYDRTSTLLPGMVLTCEPGIYIPMEKTGIRLENDILITRGKPRNLMEHIPIDPEEIESIMLQNREKR